MNTNDLLAAHAPMPEALTSGIQRALLIGSFLVVAAAVIGLKATNTRGEEQDPEAQPQLEPQTPESVGRPPDAIPEELAA